MRRKVYLIAEEAGPAEKIRRLKKGEVAGLAVASGKPNTTATSCGGWKRRSERTGRLQHRYNRLAWRGGRKYDRGGGGLGCPPPPSFVDPDRKPRRVLDLGPDDAVGLARRRVGDTGFEPVTSCVSSRRSSQLS